MEDRFVQIGQEFNEKRDMYYRRQLQTLQIDLDYIRNADLYANKPLDDFRDDASEGAITSTAGSTQGSVRTLNLSGNSRLDIPPKSGAYAAKFAQDINDAMEQRDTVLTTIVVCSLLPSYLPHSCKVEAYFLFLLLTDMQLNSMATTSVSMSS